MALEDLRAVDVDIRDDTIVEICDLSRSAATRVVDATRMVVAPGFIDMHSHSDFPLLVDGRSLSKITQGMTTELLGESDSAAPASGPPGSSGGRENSPPTTLSSIGRRLLNTSNVSNADVPGGQRCGACRRRAGARGGHGLRQTRANARTSCPGCRSSSIVRCGTEQQASPAVSSTHPTVTQQTKSLIELAKIAARHGGIYVSHIRNEADQVVDAFRESARIGREAGVSVEVLHCSKEISPGWTAFARQSACAIPSDN